MRVLMAGALITISLCFPTKAQFASCYRDITSDACGRELEASRRREQLYDLREGIAEDRLMDQDSRDFEAWFSREYNLGPRPNDTYNPYDYLLGRRRR
jgi:hypothetical protein